MKSLEDYITIIHDFPEKGVIYRDITSVIEDSDGFRLAIAELMKLLGRI